MLKPCKSPWLQNNITNYWMLVDLRFISFIQGNKLLQYYLT